jgi:hypothetical protein
MGYLLDVTSTVICAHAGQAQATAPNPRVMVSNQPTVLLTTVYAVAGCALTGTGAPPCATAQWLTGSTRLTSNGQPLLMMDSQSTCVPSGTPLTVVMAQVRVQAQ